MTPFRPLSLVVLSFLVGCASAPVVPSTALGAPDPYAWLEEVEGKKALKWARARNKESTGRLEKDPRYLKIKTKAEEILQAKDRIPYGAFRGGFVYNYWRDAKNVRGLWRRTTLDEYEKAEPVWETILDLDITHIESLCNLEALLGQGPFTFIGLPMKMRDVRSRQ